MQLVKALKVRKVHSQFYSNISKHYMGDGGGGGTRQGTQDDDSD